MNYRNNYADWDANLPNARLPNYLPHPYAHPAHPYMPHPVQIVAQDDLLTGHIIGQDYLNNIDLG